MAAIGKATASPIVRLNIGGVCYDTTELTLSSRGENFFTALLADRMDTLKDGSGAVFVDRIEYLLFFGAVGDGDYFRPILHFLRTGRIDISPNLCRAGVLAEAEFYCIEPFVDALKKEDCLREEEKAESLKNRGLKKITSGVYICKEFGWGFMFEEKEGRLLAVRSEYTGGEKETQVTFIKAHAEVARTFNRTSLGTSWGQSDRQLFAAFYENCLFRGKYRVDGQTILLDLPVSKHGISTSCIAVLSADGDMLCVDGGKLLSMNALFTKKEPRDKEIIGILNCFIPFVYHAFDS